MRRALIPFIMYLLLVSILTAQNKEIINKYRPTEVDLYKTLDQGIKSKTAKYIKLFYNEKGSYSYTQKKSFDGKGKTVIFELYGDNPDIRLSIKNLSLSGFDKVFFNVFNISEITIDSCSFINILNGVSFEFKENLNGKKKVSSIDIKNSKFIDNNLNKNKSNFSDQLKFSRNKYSKGLALLKNVTIDNCTFEMNDSSTSWQIKSVHNTYPKRHSITFYRVSSEAAFSKISIINNYFEAKAPYYRTEAITFVNDHNADFRTPKNLYEKNRDINISNNKMVTTSQDPGHGIFIQGPYQFVKVNNNKVENYGMNMIEGNNINCDGAVHLYGSRNSKYSDDLRDITVNNNVISSTSIAIKINGIQNAVIKQNQIKMLQWPEFYRKSKLINKMDRIGIKAASGAYKDKTKQSTNVLIKENVVDCNYEKACVGITVQGIKEFKIVDNKISNPTNYGILVFGHKGEKNLNVGKSSIAQNIINYGKQNFNSLNTNFYKIYNVNFAAIKVHRMDNGKKYNKESLIIKENKIIDKSNTIPKASVVDLTKSQLKSNTKSDMTIEN